MPKRAAATRPQKRDERVIDVKRGEKIEFPVSAKHPLARFQTMTPVRSADDIVAFLKLWESAAAARDQLPVAPAILVGQLKNQKVKVLRITADALRISNRAMVTLNNPLNHLDCMDVTIAGDLVAFGDLVLTCNTLTLE
jgi:hypothetical protein